MHKTTRLDTSRPRRIGETRFNDGRLRLPERQRARSGKWATIVGWTLFGAASSGAAASLMFGGDEDSPKYMSADNPWSLANSAKAREGTAVRTVENSVHYSGCHDARTAGVAPIRAGEPGYREAMDGDGDGIACEPHF